jgi:hypothetical protein
MNETKSMADVFSPEDLLPEPGEATVAPQHAEPTEAERPVAAEHEDPKPQEGPAEAQDQAPEPSEPPPPPPDPRITEGDRDAFMRHILGSRRFVKEYVLKQGAICVTLQSRTTAENDEIYEMLAADIATGKVSSAASSVDHVLRLYRYFISASLVSVAFDAGSHGVNKKPKGDSLRERHDWLTREFSETQLRLLLRCQEEFEYLQTALFRESLAEDFTGGRAGVF